MNNSSNKGKGFDCVAFTRRIQEKIYEETKDMTVDEQVAYFRQRAQRGPFVAWWKTVFPRSTGKKIASATV
jgi:hypothetical protein